MKKEILALIILAILTFIFHAKLFFPPSLYTSQDYGRGDLTHFNYPIKEFYSTSLKSHELPLWTDEIFTGFPILAESQMGAFYLPNLILFYFLPTPWAFNISYLLTFLIAATGVYFYCRYFNLNFFSSLFSATVFAFSMYFVGHIIHFNLLQAASFTPWLFLFAEKLLTKNGKFNFLIFSFILSQQIFTGYFQLTVYILSAVIFLVVFRVFTQKVPVKNALFVITSVIFGFFLAAVQLFPTIEFFQLSIRQTFLPPEFITLFPFNLKDLVSFFHPYFFGDPSAGTFEMDPFKGIFWENNVYVGILPIIFALVALTKIRQEKSILFFFMLFLITILFSLGWLRFIFYLPLFSTFRVPQKILLLSTFSLTIVSGFGLNYFLHHFREKFAKYKLLLPVLGILILAISFLNLYLLGSPYNGGTEVEEWLKIPETAKFLKENLGSDRIFSVGQNANWFRVYQNISHGWQNQTAEKLLATRAILEPNTNIVYDIASADGYAGTVTKRFDIVKTLILEGVKEDENKISISTPSAKLLSIQDVKYLVSPKPVIAENFSLVFENWDEASQTTYRIYENSENPGRIFAVKKLFPIANINQIKLATADPSFPPKDTAFIQTNLLKTDFSNSNVEIKILESKNQRLKFAAKIPNESFIVIADSFYPGWEAKIDGAATKIFPVNINSRGIIAPAGEHEITLFYNPQSFKIGLAITVFSIIIFLLVAFWGLKDLKKINKQL